MLRLFCRIIWRVSNIKKDYEWYSEDFMGCELDESTDIRIEDVWELCAERVEKVVGAKI